MLCLFLNERLKGRNYHADKECITFKVLIAAEQKELAKLEVLIKAAADLKDVIDERLHRQFLLQMQAMLMEDVYHDVNKSIDCLWQAVWLTIPDMQTDTIHKYLLSVEEITIMIQLAEALNRGNRDKEAVHMLMLVIEYAEKKYDDYEVKVRVIPRAVKALMPLLIKREEYEEGRVLVKKAIDILCWNGVLYDLLDLMEYYLVCSKHNPDEVYAKYYIKQAQALREIYREYDPENRMESKTSLEYYNHELDTGNFLLLEKKLELTRYNKANAMNYLSLTYSKEGQKDNSSFILEHLLRELGKSKVSMSDRYRTCMILIGNLSALYG